jgi:putative ABC transport system permease protein
VTALSTKAFNVRLDDGSEQRIKVELGDHGAFPVEYSSGRAPTGPGDIALSAINAKELGKRVGDGLALTVDGRERELTVCGIYSDVTNGGKTAKADFPHEPEGAMWSVLNVRLAEGYDPSDAIRRYASSYPFAKVSDLERYIDKTFGPTIDGIGKAALVSLIMALGVSALVTLLFMRLLLARDRYSISVLKAIGFANRDIAAQYLTRVMFVLVIGIALGTLLADTAGEALAGAVIAAFGASSFRFESDPLLTYVAYPLAMAAAVALAASVRAAGAGRVMISEGIKE